MQQKMQQLVMGKAQTMGKPKKVTTDRFSIIVVLISAIVTTVIIGLSFMGEKARKTEESCELSEKSDGEIFKNPTNVSFLNRRTRKVRECEDLPLIPRCICEYCSIPPEERCIRWCSDNNNDYVTEYPVDRIHLMLSKMLEVTDCWVCTKTPLMSKNMPVTPIPVSFNEMTRVSTIQPCKNGSCKNEWGKEVVSTYNLTRPPTIVLSPHKTESIPFCFLKEVDEKVKTSLQVWTSSGLYTPYIESEIMHLGRVDEKKCDTIILSFSTYPPECHSACNFDIDRDLPQITEDQRKALKEEMEQDPAVAERYNKKAHNDIMCGLCKVAYYNEKFKSTLPESVLRNRRGEPIETHLGLKIVYHIAFNIPFILPDDMYYVCGGHAYKWIPVNSEGLCYVGRLIPQFYTLTHPQMRDYLLQKPYRIKREVSKERERSLPLLHVSTGHRVGISFGNIITLGNWGFLTNQNEIERLAGFLDNVTEIYDDTFRYVGYELQAFKTELLQHRLVLDYLTAQTGGYCLTVESEMGVHCCNYITNDTTNPEEVINKKMDEAKRLKENFRKQNYDEDSENDSWWEWLNPATWFSGLGKRLSKAVYSCFKLLFIILVLILGGYSAYKCILYCVHVITSTRSKRAAEGIMVAEIYTKA